MTATRGPWVRFGLPASVAVGLILLVGVGLAAGTFKPYYIPSESMEPTFRVGDRIAMRRGAPAKLERGMVIVFRIRDHDRVYRIVGLGGDMIEMRDGVPWINGKPPHRVRLGPGPSNEFGPTERFRERLPGETHDHWVIDAGATPAPFEQGRVPAGHLFLLGDNRGNAADSRYPATLEGVGMVPATNVLGQVEQILWSPAEGWIGRRVDEGERK